MDIQLTREKAIELLKEAFALCDKDGSGFVEKAEAHTICVNLHQKWSTFKTNHGGEAKPFNEELFEKGFAAVDKSGDGKISYNEVEGFVLTIAIKRGFIAE